LVDVGSGDDGTPDVADVARMDAGVLVVKKVSVLVALGDVCVMLAAGYDVHEYALLSLADAALHVVRYAEHPSVHAAHVDPPYVPVTAPVAAHVAAVTTVQPVKSLLAVKPVGHAVHELEPGSEYVFPEHAELTVPRPPAQMLPAGHGVQPASESRPVVA